MKPNRDSRCAACGLILYSAGVTCPRCAGDPARNLRPHARTAGPLPHDDRYEVLSNLGNGGMGVVYKVRDLELDELIALKVLKTEVQHREVAVQAFKRELKLARRIIHPSVARLHDLMRWREQLAISQEYIEGRDFDAVLARGALQLEQILGYLRYICSGLGAAHQLGVVHRDLKPSNIRVDGKDRARLIDFGIATLAGEAPAGADGVILGTPFYMSPEQILPNAPIDHRSDIYSLGVLLFQMATGRLPFRSPNMMEVITSQLNDPPPRPRSIMPSVPEALEEVILKCLEKDPNDRYSSTRDLFNNARLAHKTSAASTAAPPTGEVQERSGGRALVVDADPRARRRLRNILEGLGVSVLEAKDGQEGTQTVFDQSPELILLEVELPVMDGRDVLRVLKSNSQTRDLPVVVLTKLDDPEEGMLLKEMGAAAFVTKPAQVDVIELFVEKYL